MPSEFWCDEDGIWDCPDGSDEMHCSKVRNHNQKDATNARHIRLEFQKSALKAARKQQNKTRKPNKNVKFGNNPKYWYKLREANSTGKKF